MTKPTVLFLCTHNAGRSQMRKIAGRLGGQCIGGRSLFDKRTVIAYATERDERNQRRDQ
jgi:hypothetical protein